jgi:GABA(A) receptor-associated protein
MTENKIVSDINRIRIKYPDRVPVFVKKSEYSTVPMIQNTKFLSPHDITAAQFLYIIRKRIKLKPEEALYIYIDNIMPSSNISMGELYTQYKSTDGALRITYSSENTFG